MEKPVDPNFFHTMLRASLLQWKLQGKKGVWIKLPIQLVNLVEIAVKCNFPVSLIAIGWKNHGATEIVDAESIEDLGLISVISVGHPKRLIVATNFQRLVGKNAGICPKNELQICCSETHQKRFGGGGGGGGGGVIFRSQTPAGHIYRAEVSKPK
ncbi:nudix hydrolase 10-like [Forsythia ovata]|uniref:Nudix hydrolase 10-like n=1 Tax=Forsythia ovata TaxID=205694 RepID=A0ABD1S5D4_9LAMI